MFAFSTTDHDLETFFDAMAEGFAMAASGAKERTLLKIAGHVVELSVASAALLALRRPLMHLVTAEAADQAALRILVWEGPENWSPPPLPWKQGQLGYQGEVVGLGKGRFSVNYHDVSGLFLMYDRASQTILYWIRRAADLPFWEIASPFRMAWHWWAPRVSGQVAHAAAVGVQGRGVLLVGKSGSGKSTASLACLHHGMEFLGDDYVLLTEDLKAHSLYSSAKMRTAFLAEVLPAWKESVGATIGPEHKSVFFLQEVCPELLRRSLSIDAIILPRVVEEPRAELMPCNASQAMTALAPSTVFQLPGARREALQFLARWTSRVPAYALRVGKDLDSAAALLKALATNGPTRTEEANVV